MRRFTAALTGSVALGSSIGAASEADDREPLFRADPIDQLALSRRPLALGMLESEGRCGEGKCGDAARPEPMQCVRISTRQFSFFHPSGAKRLPVLVNTCPYTVRVEIRWDIRRRVTRHHVEAACGEGKCGSDTFRIATTVSANTRRDVFFAAAEHNRSPYRWVACRVSIVPYQPWRTRPCSAAW